MSKLREILSRPAVAAGMAAVAFAGGWVIHGLAAPAPDVGSVMVYDEWRLVCPQRALAERHCELAQDVVGGKNKATVLRIGIAGDGQKPKIDMIVPFNMLLPKGIGISVDGENPETYPYRTCNQVGCIATIEDAKLYNAVLKAKQINIFYYDLNGMSSGIPVTTTNLPAAVAAMKDAEAKRASWLRRVVW